MPTEPNWLSPREDRAWRAFMHAHHRLGVRLNQQLLQDAGLTQADYELLAVLSEHPTGRIPAQEACALLQWEKSRLSHQVRHLQRQGLVTREPDPADGRSSMIVLLPAGRRAIENAAPQHVQTSAGSSSTCSPPPNSTCSPPSTNGSCATSPRKPTRAIRSRTTRADGTQRPDAGRLTEQS